MKTITKLSFLILLLCFVIGCQNHIKKNSSGLTDEDLVRIDNLFTDYTKYYLSYDWPSCIKFYTDDAIRFSPGSAPIKGLDSILESMKKTEKISKYEGENLEIYGSGNYAFVWRKFLMDVTLKGVPEHVVLAGNTLYVLKKANNTWKIHRVMWN